MLPKDEFGLLIFSKSALPSISFRFSFSLLPIFLLYEMKVWSKVTKVDTY